MQIPDVLADPAYRWPIGRELGGYRTMLGAPMLAGDRVVGVLTLWRLEVDPFDDRTIALLNTLAAQAAVAIQNAELFQLGEISQAVSSTLDLDEVLTTSSPAPRSCPAPREARSSSTTGLPGCLRCAPASGRIPV